MALFLTIASGFAPVFIAVVLGYGARASVLIPRASWDGANQINYRLLLPSLLFVTIAEVDFSASGSIAAASALATSLMAAASLLIGWRVAKRPPERAAVSATGAAWNLFLIYAIAVNLFPDEGAALTAAAIGAAAPLIAGFCVLVFAGGKAGPLSTLWRVARDPIVIGCAAGFAANAANLAQAAPLLLSAFEVIGMAGIGIILLAIGAGLDFPALRGRLKPLLAAALTRTLIAPFGFFGIGLAFGLSGPALAVLTLAGGAPAAAFTYAMAREFEGEAGLAAGIITLTVLISAAALPLFTALALAV